MRWFLGLVLGLVALAAVASVAYGHDPSNPGTTVAPTPTIGDSPPLRPSASVNGTNGVRLTLSINATSLSEGQALGISLVDYNTLAYANYLTAVRDWSVGYLSDGPCGTDNQPMGFAVFSGYYLATNASAAAPLPLYAPGGYNCPLLVAGITAYDFSPFSSNAEVYAMCTPNPCFDISVNATDTVSGYWPSPQVGVPMQALQPGVYTVVGGDEWGDLLFLHFTVT